MTVSSIAIAVAEAGRLRGPFEKKGILVMAVETEAAVEFGERVVIKRPNRPMTRGIWQVDTINHFNLMAVETDLS